MRPMDKLGVSAPYYKSYVIRNNKCVTIEQRVRALQATEYNMFSFPADLLCLDFLSDSGTTSMTDRQWAAMFLGDEAYGRNRGYYLLLEAFRDIFERGDSPKNAINMVMTGEENIDLLLEQLYLCNYEGGLVNGGIFQLIRPNAFICPQGRVAESLLFSTLAEILVEEKSTRQYYIPNNGHFDTTGANIRFNRMIPVNIMLPTILDEFPLDQIDRTNPFKGDMDIKQLDAFITEKGPQSIPLIYLTITNNSMAGQPVSLSNIRAVAKIAKKYQIPLFFDACRFAENAYFIKEFEKGYKKKTIRAIVQEMFQNADGFTISLKKDGLANMGGALCIRDNGQFVQRYSHNGKNVGIRLKERQIITIGNDSYGALSGHDIMSIAVGLYEVTKDQYLTSRISQTQYFARKLAENSVPVVLPPGGHAIYLDMDKFFAGTEMLPSDFGGVGFTIELIKHYGIRACELGPFAFEWDQHSEEERKGILNLVRFAIPRNAYSNSDIDYAVAAVTELYKHRDQIPKVRISRGAELNLRHFQTGLEPIYPSSD